VTVTGNGDAGNFKVGTVIMATGAEELRPVGWYRYAELPNVVTQLEFEKRFKAAGDVPQSVVMINCVGARIPERTYCGRFCCTTAIKNAIWLKEQGPESRVFVLHRDVMAYGVDVEKSYRRAMELGVRFVRYDVAEPPRVWGENRADSVRVRHQLMGKEMVSPADLVILTTPLVAREDNERLSKMLKVPLGSDGFFLEAHLKLRPIEFSTDGVYVCGCRHGTLQTSQKACPRPVLRRRRRRSPSEQASCAWRRSPPCAMSGPVARAATVCRSAPSGPSNCMKGVSVRRRTSMLPSAKGVATAWRPVPAELCNKVVSTTGSYWA
jgi:heterodisulfide reductase subunit A-like polyferredoxin